MTLHLTPEVLAGAYTFLRATQPFSRWKLPPAEEQFIFRVVSDPLSRGYYQPCRRKDRHIIAVSETCVGYTPALITTMAHEMCHLRLRLIGKGRVNHGTEFQRLARQVCKSHGFDPKEF